MKLNKRFLSLTLFCAIATNASNMHAFSFAPWQDLSCWWQETINPFSLVDFSTPFTSISENTSSFFSSGLFTKVGALFASIGIGAWIYKKRTSAGRKTGEKLWFLKDEAPDLSSERSILKAFAAATGHKLDIDGLVNTKLQDCEAVLYSNQKILQNNLKNLAHAQHANEKEILKLEYAAEIEKRRKKAIAKYLNQEVQIIVGMQR